MEKIEDLIILKKDYVLSITLNRPKTKNSITGPTMAAIQNRLVKAINEDDVKVIYFTGTGDNFSSGNDFGNFGNATLDEMIIGFEEFINFLITYPKILIAGVNGMCVGIGFTMLINFDIILAADSAFFMVPFIQTMQVPEGTSSFMLPLLIGKGLAGHMLLNGGTINSEEAKNTGFVSKVFEKKSFEEDAYDYALNTAKHSSGSLKLIKEMMKKFNLEKLKEVNKYECLQLRKAWDNPEFKNIVRKFSKASKF